jgi:hypothetical protein
VIIDWRNAASKAQTEISLMLEKDFTVAEAKIVTNEGDFGNVKLVIEIIFNDNATLMVGKVDEKGCGPIEIYRIGDYEILVLNRYGARKFLTMDLLNYITGLQLKTVYDLPKNYNKIYKSIEILPNISEYREYAYESMNTIIDRMLAMYRDKCKIINFEDQRYFLAIYDYDDFDSFRRTEKF